MFSYKIGFLIKKRLFNNLFYIFYSIVNFEHVTAGWDTIKIRYLRYRIKLWKTYQTLRTACQRGGKL